MERSRRRFSYSRSGDDSGRDRDEYATDIATICSLWSIAITKRSTQTYGLSFESDG